MSCDQRIIQGDDVTLEITAKDLDGTAINLSGASIILWIVQEIGGAAVLTKSTSSGITITDADDGVFEVALSAANTADLEGRYFYEAQITDSSNKKTTLRQEDSTIPFFYVLPDVVT